MMRLPPRVQTMRSIVVAGLGRLQQRQRLRLELLRRERQAQVRGRVRHPREVLVERVRHAAVEPHDLEDAVAAQQPVVGDRHRRRGGRRGPGR